MAGGLSGERMLLGLCIGIILLVVLVLKTRVHAFLALIIAGITAGMIGGMPLTDIKLEDGTTFGVLNSIRIGFGNTLGNIGIVIGFGLMMGQLLEVTGAAEKMAQVFLKLFGKKREEEAMAFTGFLVSIPIFCDSGFVILAPIAKAIAKVTKKSVTSLGIALAAGLFITHCLVPPTPGPLGVCGIFGIDSGRFILLTIVLSVPITLACIPYARAIGKKIHPLQDETDEEFQRRNKLPSALEAFSPIVVPILLILMGTVTGASGIKSATISFLQFLGSPMVAVGIGLLLAIVTLGRGMERKKVLETMEQGMASAGIIMLVTGGGGALGQIIKDSGLGNYMASELSKTAIPLVLLPLIIASVMKAVQGSSTVAMTTAASISAPVILAAGINPFLGAAACCVGAMFFSYFNDSYFWVVNRMLGISDTREQLRAWSVTSVIAWSAGLLEILILNLFL